MTSTRRSANTGVNTAQFTKTASQGTPDLESAGAGLADNQGLDFWDALTRTAGQATNLVNAFKGKTSQPASATQAPKPKGFKLFSEGTNLWLVIGGAAVLVVVLLVAFKKKK